MQIEDLNSAYLLAENRQLKQEILNLKEQLKVHQRQASEPKSKWEKVSKHIYEALKP
jgi:cell division septum initiation protein DivIVA